MKTLASLNQVAGREVEVTIRGERSFTFSFDVIDNKATASRSEIRHPALRKENDMTRAEHIIEVVENYGIGKFKSHKIEEIIEHLENGGYIATFDSGDSGEDDTLICYGTTDYDSARNFAEEIIDDYWMQLRHPTEDSDERPDSWVIIEVLKIEGSSVTGALFVMKGGEK